MRHSPKGGIVIPTEDHYVSVPSAKETMRGKRKQVLGKSGEIRPRYLLR